MRTSPPQDAPPEAAGHRQPGAHGSRDNRLSRGLSDVAILTVVILIASFQLADWVLGQSKTSNRLKIV